MSDEIIQLAQLGTIAVGFLGVAVTLRSHRRQMHAQMFIEFSSRFHDVLGAMPLQIWMTGDAVEAVPQSGELTRCCLQCFHMMAGLYFLHKGGYVSKELWRPVQGVIKRAMQSSVLQHEWSVLESIFSHNPDFCHYVCRLAHSETAGAFRSALRFRHGA